tara:strand:- start:102 stop:368 length:267 start_codon:yes stop_codon:yes gene_type:complete
MFFEKWFDKGDLVSYTFYTNFAVYDENGKPDTISEKSEPQVAVFLEYVNMDNYQSCKIYVSSMGRCIIVPQHEISLLSKNQDYSCSKN